jgi:hypothetical protein
MADKIRNVVGTQSKFTLSEIATMLEPNQNFPGFYPIRSVDINGTPQPTDVGLVNVKGGDVITVTFTYKLSSAQLLRKLVGSKAKLNFSIPVAKYENNWTATAVNQTINFLKNDGSQLFNPVTIPDGNTNYAYGDYKRTESLTSEVSDYLQSGQPIKIQYTNVGSHDGTQMSLLATFALYTY